MSDWTNPSSPFDKTRTYAVTTTTTTTTTTATNAAADNGSKVRKKMPQQQQQQQQPAEVEHIRKRNPTTGEVVEHIPSAPSSELFELLCRLQSSRLDDQRCSLPTPGVTGGNPNSQPGAARLTPSKIVLQVSISQNNAIANSPLKLDHFTLFNSHFKKRSTFLEE